MYTFCDSNLARACRFLVCGAVIENLSNLDLPLTVIKDDAYKIIQGYFCKVITMREKQILARVIGIQKGNWVTTHFLEIIKKQ